MKAELACAAEFLARTLRLDNAQAAAFAERLQGELEQRFKGHWYPYSPHRGSGFRALHHSLGAGRSDDALTRAAQAVGMRLEGSSLPPELTVWIDPAEVSVRVGERGGVFNLPLGGGALDSYNMPAGRLMSDASSSGRGSPATSPSALSPRTSPRISHALPILDVHQQA